ncbi:MAG TPA: hypothetical protein VMF65_18090 [Acidimicrobiales bacterium]|nr:hypothetical protein [Acidimicrobiales bacterium]
MTRMPSRRGGEVLIVDKWRMLVSFVVVMVTSWSRPGRLRLVFVVVRKG